MDKDALILHRSQVWLFKVALLALFLAGCVPFGAALPTPVPLIALPATDFDPETGLPYTWTPSPTELAAANAGGTLAPTLTPTITPILPTRTPVTPTSTPTLSPTATFTATGTPVPLKPYWQYSYNEPLPYQVYPRPANDNGWGMHWIPTVSQDRGTVDRFIAELQRMHIKWVVFLNDGTQIGDNDYLVDRLVSAGIMPVMRLYRSGVLPYDGAIGPMVAHYRQRGVLYYQLYNEPNVNIENHQGSANPNVYAREWANAARDVVANGGFPGLGALSPGGAYNHFHFLDRTLRAIKRNGDGHLLNRAWLSVHNYHGTRPLHDPGGFLLYREYDALVRSHIGRSLPIIGTEGGSYSTDPQAELYLLSWQYNQMANAEPYFFAFSWWLLANKEGGSWDDSWEWQALFRPGWTHPAVGEFFYKNSGRRR